MSHKIIFAYINKFRDYPILYEYCTVLQAKGYEVYYFGISENDEFFFDSSGVTVVHVGKNKVSSRFKLAAAFAAFYKKTSPDLVHVFHFRWCFLLPLFSLFSAKFVLDVRSVHVVNKKGKHSVLTPLKNSLTWLESLFYTHCIALTEEIKKMLSPSKASIPVIPLGASVSRFRPLLNPMDKAAERSRIGLPANSIALIYSGTVNPIRKINILIEAFKELSLKVEGVHLMIVGDDKDTPDTLVSLKKLAKDLSISDKILFTGFVTYDKLVHYYHLADIGLCYVPQVKYYEHQPPTKLFEYLAAELVTIATDTKAVRAVLNHGINGFITNDNAEDFSACMFEVITKYWRDRFFIIEKSKIVTEKYSWNNIITTYLCPYYAMILNTKT
jgi:glycosyltransferase involved in cell wall biosynthesis